MEAAPWLLALGVLVCWLGGFPGRTVLGLLAVLGSDMGLAERELVECSAIEARMCPAWVGRERKQLLGRGVRVRLVVKLNCTGSVFEREVLRCLALAGRARCGPQIGSAGVSMALWSRLVIRCLFFQVNLLAVSSSELVSPPAEEQQRRQTQMLAY